MKSVEMKSCVAPNMILPLFHILSLLVDSHLAAMKFKLKTVTAIGDHEMLSLLFKIRKMESNHAKKE